MMFFADYMAVPKSRRIARYEKAHIQDNSISACDYSVDDARYRGAAKGVGLGGASDYTETPRNYGY